MFYCEDCRKKYGYQESIVFSHGPCELCKKVGKCYDLPSKYLKVEKKEKTKED